MDNKYHLSLYYAVQEMFNETSGFVFFFFVLNYIYFWSIKVIHLQSRKLEKYIIEKINIIQNPTLAYQTYLSKYSIPPSVQFSSVTQSCPTLCYPMEYSMPGLPVHHQLQSLLKLMSIPSVMPPNHLILCRTLLLLPSIFPRIRVFSNESVIHIR